MVTLDIKEIQRHLPLWEYIAAKRIESGTVEGHILTNGDIIGVFEEVQALKEATGIPDILTLLTTYAESWEIPIPPEVWPDVT